MWMADGQKLIMRKKVLLAPGDSCLLPQRPFSSLISVTLGCKASLIPHAGPGVTTELNFPKTTKTSALSVPP